MKTKCDRYGKEPSLVCAKTRKQSKDENMTTPDLLFGPPLPRRPSHISSPFGFIYTHASRVQAFLTSASEELKAYFGDYNYMILENPRAPRRYKYEIHAVYMLHGEYCSFVDGRGRTPSEALLSVNQMRNFMRKIGMMV